MKTKFGRVLAALAALTIVLAAVGQNPEGPRTRYPLIADASLAARATRPVPPEALPVSVDVVALRAVHAGALIALDNLVPGFFGVAERREDRSATSFSIFGRVNGDPESLIVLTAQDDVVVGVIQYVHAEVNYRLRYAGNGVHVLLPAIAGNEGCGAGDVAAAGTPSPSGAQAPHAEADAAERPGSTGQPRACAAPRRRFDLLMYYTVAAANANGGTSAAIALCQTGVDLANQAYIDSNISARMFLLDARQVTYTESGDLETDRDRLQDDNDGFLDFAPVQRDEIGADLVCLMVAESDAALAGIAFCTPNEAHGYCVIEEDDVDDGTHVLAHEVGHLQGCAHNHGDAGTGCNEYCYSFGHRFTGSSGTGWRTIMAYDDAGNNFANVVPRFSNPNQTWDGVSLGVDTFPCGVFPSNDDADNARSIDDNAMDVEAFRDPAIEVWVDNGYAGTEHGTWWEPWSTLGEGITAIYGGSNAPVITPTLKVKAGDYTATPVVTKPMRIESCGGSVRIGV
jgi:hypothetical protein